MGTIALTTTHLKNELTAADLVVKDLSFIKLNVILHLLKLA